MSISSPPPDAAWGKPRWGVCVLYAALASALICWPAWPGYMSYDSLLAYRQSLTGVQTMLWPPMHSYLFWISRTLGAGTWGLFVGQTFLLFFAAALCVNLLTKRLLFAAAGLLAFALAFVYAPELMGCAMVHWHDIPTASFALAGLALWVWAARRGSSMGLVGAAAAFAVSAALRYNAILLLAPPAALMVAQPFLGRPPPPRVRALVAAAMIAGFGLAWASTHWRLPDFRRLPAAASLGGTQEFDLIGISACADKVYLPPAVTDGWAITPAQIRQLYDPRHLQRAYRILPGVPRLYETSAAGEVPLVWRLAVRHELRCYLEHRRLVFIAQMGLDRGEVFYPIHAGIDANPYGLALAHPQASERVAAYVEAHAPEVWRRPATLYLLAALAAAALWVRRGPWRWLFLSLLAGAYAYAGVLFFVAPAADARYIFPSTVACALLIAAGLAVLLDGRRPAGP